MQNLLLRYRELSEAGVNQTQAARILNIPRSTLQDRLAHQRKLLAKVGGPKIMFLDIETAAAIALTFGRKKLFLSQENIIEEGGWLLCASWKWNYENKIQASRLSGHEAIAKYDYDLCVKLHAEISKADVVVAHFGRGFDFPMLRTRFLMHGLPPLPPVKFIDTKLMASKVFRFPDNKLHTISSTLGLGGKLDAGGIETWGKAQNGDEASLKHLDKYCQYDTKLLEGVFWMLSSFGTMSTFNAALYFNDDKHRCVSCGSEDLTQLSQTAKTPVGEFKTYACDHCGAIQRDRTNLVPAAKRKSVLTPIPVHG